jgi:hypothetical protein
VAFAFTIRIRALLHFVPAGFATIEEAEKTIELQPQAEPRALNAIWFRSERLKGPKRAL